eukprot:6424254-Alexandrium_andersonii.AAC.1
MREEAPPGAGSRTAGRAASSRPRTPGRTAGAPHRARAHVRTAPPQEPRRQARGRARSDAPCHEHDAASAPRGKARKGALRGRPP